MKIKNQFSQLYQNPTFIIFTNIHELSKNITNIYMYIINLVYKYQINYITIFITIMILKRRRAFHCQQQQTHKMKKIKNEIQQKLRPMHKGKTNGHIKTF